MITPKFAPVSSGTSLYVRILRQSIMIHSSSDKYQPDPHHKLDYHYMHLTKFLTNYKPTINSRAVLSKQIWLQIK